MPNFERLDPKKVWFSPVPFYEFGYPLDMSSALRRFPPIKEEIERLVLALAPRRPLEIGPGDRPVIARTARPCYLDLAVFFLANLAGERVRGDARRPPFREGIFDLAIANDIFTHVRPPERAAVLAAIAPLAPRLVVFNPEPVSIGPATSPVENPALAAELMALGFAVEYRQLVTEREDGADYLMALLLAWRPALAPFAPPPAEARGLYRFVRRMNELA